MRSTTGWPPPARPRRFRAGARHVPEEQCQKLVDDEHGFILHSDVRNPMRREQAGHAAGTSAPSNLPVASEWDGPYWFTPSIDTLNRPPTGSNRRVSFSVAAPGSYFHFPTSALHVPPNSSLL